MRTSPFLSVVTGTIFVVVVVVVYTYCRSYSEVSLSLSLRSSISHTNVPYLGVCLPLDITRMFEV